MLQDIEVTVAQTVALVRGRLAADREVIDAAKAWADAYNNSRNTDQHGSDLEFKKACLRLFNHVRAFERATPRKGDRRTEKR